MHENDFVDTISIQLSTLTLAFYSSAMWPISLWLKSPSLANLYEFFENQKLGRNNCKIGSLLPRGLQSSIHVYFIYNKKPHSATYFPVTKVVLAKTTEKLINCGFTYIMDSLSFSNIARYECSFKRSPIQIY